ncbi:MAG: hypothetical protein WC489_07055 [Patescibacteria group bacterium]
MMQITEEIRKQIYDDLADLMIEGVDRKELPITEMKKSAQFILETLDTIKSEDELLNFLQVLGEKWRTYAIELVRYEGKKTESADVQKIHEIQNRLSNLIHA